MTVVTTEKVQITPAPRRPWPPLLHRMVKTIRSRTLIEKGQHVLVAVSGGPDSVALLSLFHRLRSPWRLTVTAVHFNYGLRGPESDQDQAFVTELCSALDVPLYTRRLDLSCRPRGTSLQAEARELRYGALSSIAGECGADRIAVGHTADDQAETVLLWMLRGAGLTGLSGMAASRAGNIIRPLLESTRDEVLAYLAGERRAYREDSSNATLRYVRNQIRHGIMPALKQRFPSSVQALGRLADLCREDDRYLDFHVTELARRHVRAQGGGWVVERAFVHEQPLAVQRRLVRDLLRRCEHWRRAPGARTIDRVLHEIGTPKHAMSFTINGTRLVVEGDMILVAPPGRKEMSAQPSSAAAEALAIPSEVVWTGTGQKIRVEEHARAGIVDATDDPHRIVVDADRFSGPLVVRSWRHGERFYPRGMKGRSKKLQDFFTDLKVPAGDRRNIPLVAVPEGIVWIVGYRQDERWAVTEKTRHCLVLTASAKSHREGVS